jgi:trans-aconitate methyltransferase
MPEDNRPPGYHWDPVFYNRHSSAQQHWAEELIAKLLLRGDEHVLDIGCGDGKVTAEIARQVPDGSVVGVDSSEDMIRFACDTFPARAYPNLSFHKMDARALTFSSDFDLVFSNAALHWISDQRSVLAGIERSLHSGGRLLVQTGGKGNAAQAFRAFDAMCTEPPWSQYFAGFSFAFAFFSTEEYRQWLVTAHLDPVRIEFIGKDMAYYTEEEFAGWVRTTWHPWLQRVPVDMQPKFAEALYNHYCALYPKDSSGAVHIGMVRLEVEASKP